MNEIKPSRQGLSMDWWSVIIAIAAAILVKFNVLSKIPW
jgi:hypothetical protein